MNKINEALDEIIKIECPTGELEKRINNILVDYDLINKNTIVTEDETLNTIDAKAFCANTSNGRLVVMARSGMDDYVATVVSAYIR